VKRMQSGINHLHHEKARAQYLCEYDEQKSYKHLCDERETERQRDRETERANGDSSLSAQVPKAHSHAYGAGAMQSRSRRKRLTRMAPVKTPQYIRCAPSPTTPVWSWCRPN
jgi:hypothetical protein